MIEDEKNCLKITFACLTSPQGQIVMLKTKILTSKTESVKVLAKKKIDLKGKKSKPPADGLVEKTHIIHCLGLCKHFYTSSGDRGKKDVRLLKEFTGATGKVVGGRGASSEVGAESAKGNAHSC